MASELKENNRKKADRKVNIATILIVISGMGFLAVCALISGIMSFKLGTSWWVKAAGILSILDGITRFIDMGILVEKVAKRPYDIQNEDENLVKNALCVVMSIGFLLSGIINISIGVTDWIRNLGILATILGGVDIIDSCCAVVCPIVSKGQSEIDSFEDIFFENDSEIEKEDMKYLELQNKNINVVLPKGKIKKGNTEYLEVKDKNINVVLSKGEITIKNINVILPKEAIKKVEEKNFNKEF